MDKQRQRILRWLLALLLATTDGLCCADVFIIGPFPPPGGQGNTDTFFPFFLQQIRLQSMRYQQVYNASVFSNVPPECIYISTLAFFQGSSQSGCTILTVTNMQINLSTTQRAADGLSTNFVENVGPDDTIVFGPEREDFNNCLPGRFLIQLDRPFRYNPALGNLLLDVRIFNGGGPQAMNLPRLAAFDPATDGSSRVWSTNVADAVATGVDTIALDTVMQLSAVPSLVIYTTGTTNTPTNYIVIDWPNEPSVFRLQQSERFGPGSIWQTVTNAAAPRYFFPVESAGSAAFYRLIWDSGQPLQPATVPIIPEGPPESLHTR